MWELRDCPRSTGTLRVIQSQIVRRHSIYAGALLVPVPTRHTPDTLVRRHLIHRHVSDDEAIYQVSGLEGELSVGSRTGGYAKIGAIPNVLQEDHVLLGRGVYRMSSVGIAGRC